MLRGGTLLEAYALADFRCPILGCEPKYREEGSNKLSKPTDFASPAATYWGPERDSQGNFTGIGVSPGLGTNPDPSSVRIRSLFIVQHWMAWHMKSGLNLVLPCLITQKGPGEPCCTEQSAASVPGQFFGSV